MKVHNPNNLPTLPIADLLPTQGDLKDLSDKNYNKLKNTIDKRGFSVPVYVWEDGKGIKHLLDGHQRQRVLTTEGWNDPIPYLKVPAKDLQEAMARLLEITSQYGTVTQEGIDQFIAKYDLPEAEIYEATHFDAVSYFGADEEESEVVEDEVPEVDESEPPKSVPGTVYQLGRHRLMCGDSTTDDVKKLMNGLKANLCFSDPPYNVAYGETMKDKLRGNNRTILNDKMSDEEFDVFLEKSMKNILDNTDGSIYICMSSSEMGSLQDAFKKMGGHWSTFIIWAKNTFTMGRSDYQRQYEPILYGWREGVKERYWCGARNQGDVWNFNKPSNSKLHPTMKPIELVAKAITNSSEKNAIVLDTFLGSGSTLIAAEQTGRICYGMELDPKYADVIRKRYATFIQPDDVLPENWEELTPAVKD